MRAIVPLTHERNSCAIKSLYFLSIFNPPPVERCLIISHFCIYFYLFLKNDVNSYLTLEIFINVYLKKGVGLIN